MSSHEVYLMVSEIISGRTSFDLKDFIDFAFENSRKRADISTIVFTEFRNVLIGLK